MKGLDIKLIICGMAVLLFAIVIACTGQSEVSYIIGGLGLFLVCKGCFEKDHSNH